MRLWFQHILILLLIACSVALGCAWMGFYNPGALETPNVISDWYLKMVRENGISRRIRDLKAPPLNNPALIKEGAGHYAAMCSSCHLAPGMHDSDIRHGLSPVPPILSQTADKLMSTEIFWTIKHGIGFTAMPAWGPSHSDQKIWAITAFVKKLPNMTPAEYQALKAGFTDDD
jgi:mono/diheme cytochrome c family protein